MSYSSSSNFSITRDDIIKAALRIVHALPADDDPSDVNIVVTSAITNAATILNMLVKSWQSDDIGIWLNKEATLFLDTTSQSYTINNTTSDKIAYSSTITETAIKTAGSETDTSIIVDSITGISDGDYIGIELDDGTMQWSTVNGDPAGYTVALDDALTDDIAVDNKVYAFTSMIDRPIDVLEARLRSHSDTDTPMFVAGRIDYMDLNNKEATGSPHTVYYDKQLADGELYIYPVSDSSLLRIVMTVKTLVYDFDSATDNPHFPIEWSNALKWGLAAELIPEYPEKVNGNMVNYINSMARQSLASAKGGDIDGLSVRIIPDYRRMR